MKLPFEIVAFNDVIEEFIAATHKPFQILVESPGNIPNILNNLLKLMHTFICSFELVNPVENSFNKNYKKIKCLSNKSKLA